MIIFCQSPSTICTEPNAFHCIWTTLELILPEYIRTYAKNVNLLWKSRDDCQADAVLRNQLAVHTASEDPEWEQPSYAGSDPENDPSNASLNTDESWNIETLLAAFLAISRRWN
jgi:hypothetical protein